MGVGDGIAAHIEDDRRDLFSGLYTQIALLGTLSGISNNGQGGLDQFLVPLELDPSVRSRLIEQVLSEQSRNDLAALVSLQVMGRMWALGKAPPAKKLDEFIEENTGTIKYCRDNGLPLDNWREKLAAERASSLANNDSIAKYLAKHRR